MKLSFQANNTLILLQLLTHYSKLIDKLSVLNDMLLYYYYSNLIMYKLNTFNFQNLCKLNLGKPLWDLHNGNYPVLLKVPYLLKIKVGLIGKELSVKNLFLYRGQNIKPILYPLLDKFA